MHTLVAVQILPLLHAIEYRGGREVGESEGVRGAKKGGTEGRKDAERECVGVVGRAIDARCVPLEERREGALRIVHC